MDEFENDIDQLKRHIEKKLYCIRCRLCRKQLLVSDKIKFSHPGKAELCGNCLFLDEEFLPSWINNEIECSSWTKGRLKCPRVECTARVGGFDYIQGLLCGCGELTIPAIWIQDGKVDVRAIDSNDDVKPKSKASLEPNVVASNKPGPVQMSVFKEELTRGWQNKGVTSINMGTDLVEEKFECIKTSCDADKTGRSNLCWDIKSWDATNVRNNAEVSSCNVADSDIGEVVSKSKEACASEWAGIHSQSSFVNDTLAVITDDASSAKLVQELFRQGNEEMLKHECGQPIFHDSRSDICIDKMLSDDLSASAITTTAKRRKHKVNRRETDFMEDERTEIKETLSDTTKPIEMKLHGRTKYNKFNSQRNRFNTLPVEEPTVMKPSHDANLHTAIQEHLICAVCLDYFYEPYLCPCSHVFCESCLRQLYHKRAGSMKCPICRSSVKFIMPAMQVRNEIDQLRNTPAIKQRELLEKTAKYRKWPLPPMGILPQKRRNLAPKQHQTLVIFACVVLFGVCYTAMLYLVL